MKSKYKFVLASFTTLFVQPSVQALELNFALRTAAGFQADGQRDLDLTNSATNETFYLNASPRVMIQFDQDWSMFIRGRGFLPTGDLLDTDETQQTVTNEVGSFVKLDELWVRYGGFTSYPGESVRIGHQLIRDLDRSWIGRDLDAVNWVFSTTNIQSSAGVFYQFSSYRSDGIDIPPDQKDRIYGYTNFGFDWIPQHQVGFRALHARDLKELPLPGEIIDSGDKFQKSALTWLGVHASNGYLVASNPSPLKYWADVTYLFGETSTDALAGDRLVTGISNQKLSAISSTTGLRWRPTPYPLSVGLEYVYSSGGGKAQYRQSGIQANSVAFTGASTSAYRYNDALRAQLGNLQIATAYLSINKPKNDLALIVQKFTKTDKLAPIVTNNVSAPTSTGSADVGWGADVLTSYYFDTPAVAGDVGDSGVVSEDPRSSVRLRASVFNPGSTYGSSAKLNYRVIVETTLWWF